MSTAMETKADNRSEEQARAQFESVKAMGARLEHCDECDGSECELDRDTILEGVNIYPKQKISKSELAEYRAQYHNAEEARETIEQDALSVQVRSGWQTPGEKMEAAEYCILLCTGGPAVRIVGELSQYNEPETARIEHQDWFTPWTELCDVDRDALLAYARVFYYGE